MMPSYFFAHGAPSLVIEEHGYTDFLKQFAKGTAKPKAIVLFSAHYENQVQSIGAVADTYSTIYDFSGFPDQLYQMTYPAKGDAALSKQIQSLFEVQGIPSRLDHERGLDHGSWAVLKLLYPDADIPVIALSVNRSLTNEQQYQIGRALAALKEQDIMIIGSGGTVHNLRRIQWNASNPEDWAVSFDHWLQSKLETWDLEALFNYREEAPYGTDAVPTTEHFIPLLLAMGSGDRSRKATRVYQNYQMGTLSLGCWQFE
ncbi:DODA-type extradiol aromatic ring-opening family dioxygenase [Paenibacillus solisilvae]|uniref:DODA-type extradiol aromatic ring-opening family dioxygenase n=1 Tax=Paenibacillus solisilvae TaxID=2486751 RepID=A0ABW0W475_9BACL